MQRFGENGAKQLIAHMHAGTEKYVYWKRARYPLGVILNSFCGTICHGEASQGPTWASWN